MSRSLTRFLVLLAPIGLLTASGATVASHRVDRTTWDSVYSATQAGRGETAYARTCARCHGAALGGGDEATPLAGSAFLGNWNGQAVSDLQKRIVETMPSDSVGIYDRTLATDVIAFMLKANGFPAGAIDLSVEPDSLKSITIATEKKPARD
jgi:hypothetical protein